jgi:hypothetical protein
MFRTEINVMTGEVTVVELTREEIAALPPPPPPPPPSFTITKIRLVEALAAAGKLRQAYRLLKLEAPLNDLTDAELALRERWNAAHTLDLQSAEVAPFLAALDVAPESLAQQAAPAPAALLELRHGF